jgi:hypothetical protein
MSTFQINQNFDVMASFDDVMTKTLNFTQKLTFFVFHLKIITVGM